MSVKLPETARGLFGLAVAVALGSLWLWALLITLLPEGGLALQFAAFLSMLLGLGCAIGLAFHGAGRLEQERKDKRRA